MGRRQAILCDLFETVVLFDPSNLPRMPQGGKDRPSTTPLLLPLLTPHLRQLTLDALHEALLRSWAAARRAVDHAEIPSPRRFEGALVELGLDAGAAGPLAWQVAEAHTDAVCGTAHLPMAHREALGLLGRRHKLGLVSNFDHGPACRRLLARVGLTEVFEAVVISDELGWRKPHPRPFEAALEALGVEAGEALFVGDSPSDDLAGAAACGLTTAWINPRGRPLPEGIPEPDYIIGSLAELPGALGIHPTSGA